MTDAIFFGAISDTNFGPSFFLRYTNVQRWPFVNFFDISRAKVGPSYFLFHLDGQSWPSFFSRTAKANGQRKPCDSVTFGRPKNRTHLTPHKSHVIFSLFFITFFGRPKKQARSCLLWPFVKSQIIKPLHEADTINERPKAKSESETESEVKVKTGSQCGL